MNKRAINDLAIFGGAPMYSEKVYVGRPNLGNRESLMNRIDGILSRRWLSNHGPLVQELEQRICEMLGVKHCILVCNGTIGLEIAIRALDLRGEVIVPSFTFIATAHALQWLGIKPVFCDVDPLTHNLDPNCVERLITPSTTGILGVHLWGRPAAVEPLKEIADRHNLRLMFDAAHAFGCSHKQRMIGNFGDLEVFSFHATKFFHTFEGGAIVTNCNDLAERARMMENFGFSAPDVVDMVGTNGKMTEISAAMGLTGLESLDEFTSVNRRNYLHYKEGLTGLPGITMADYAQDERSNFQYIVLEVDESRAGITRDRLVDVLQAENVMARRYFHPGCHLGEPYRSKDPNAGMRLPVTERLAKRVMALPNGTAVGPDQVSDICGLIGFVLENPASIASAA